jgi:WhiB family redox-sensing transcriptional regulator
MARSAYDPPRLLDRTEVTPCAGVEADLWFASHPVAIERAKTLCQSCPLREECLAEAMERREPWGVWGGELFENGAVIKHKRRPGRPRKNATRLAS